MKSNQKVKGIIRELKNLKVLKGPLPQATGQQMKLNESKEVKVLDLNAASHCFDLMETSQQTG